jgi:hypothetical protein
MEVESVGLVLVFQGGETMKPDIPGEIVPQLHAEYRRLCRQVRREMPGISEEAVREKVRRVLVEGEEMKVGVGLFGK